MEVVHAQRKNQVRSADQAGNTAACQRHLSAGWLRESERVYRESDSLLCGILVSALQGTVENAENHIARLLFKLAVETNMMMNVLASEVDVSAEALERLRGRCIQEVKKTGGAVTFADAMKYQRGE